MWSGWVSSALVAASVSVWPPEDATELVRRAVSWIEAEGEWTERYDYLTGGEVRLLLFWTGEDDAGRGYIRLGRKKGNPELETISLLFGSVPDRAPLALNRWGAATETLRRESESGEVLASAFLGFRKASADAEAAASRPESESDGGNDEGFEASLNYVGRDVAVARVLAIDAGEAIDLRGMERVQRRALRRFQEKGLSVRWLEEPGRRCGRVTGFLFTMKALLDEVASGNTPPSRCYIYNARAYTVSVRRTERIESREVTLELEQGGEERRRYRDLVEVELETLNHESGNRTQFQVTVGTRGRRRGVPVEIVYQPSTWVRIRIQLSGDGR